ncbi:hypothetical protein ASPVEDRAFT_432399 [Aspergillus versicolor CBS 583.65]|uniref:Uncharacterized protein n=1 Tax=Aspergillus versicolor CBS 583.65 TaxID=1036611 RepID=A0A1L9P8R0_ASPVE|nr:uncharacterized protein ASPVEDRAFT_432399 [Aspergillus versicolor CBS 583.65]OJI97834.1 hypothetical protein ASPVEDRAFT_432399 [Aspergillus versicolor CBS 583.65]
MDASANYTGFWLTKIRQSVLRAASVKSTSSCRAEILMRPLRKATLELPVHSGFAPPPFSSSCLGNARPVDLGLHAALATQQANCQPYISWRVCGLILNGHRSTNPHPHWQIGSWIILERGPLMMWKRLDKSFHFCRFLDS